MKIGVFDSGVGGLTVLREIRRLCPAHSTVYLGDSARVPYGTKSAQTIARYSRANADFLLREGVDFIVVACNTATAFGLSALKDLPVPVLGVIAPGVRYALELSRSNRLGVLGTPGTVKSNAYVDELKRLRPDASVQQIACPLFVPLVDEGWENSEVARLVIQKYLAPWIRQPEAAPDTVILGCTHYPLLKDAIAAELNPSVVLIDSAEAVAREVVKQIGETAGESEPVHKLFLTDVSEVFVRFAERFWDKLDMRPTIELVDLDMNLAHVLERER